MYRVLVVDDEERITDSLAGMLEETSCFELDVYKAYSGKEALLLLEKFQFDIVISDICMPGMTGIELVDSIRQKWPLCHVIFQTGYDEFQYAQQAIRQKVDHYILKSEGDDALIHAIGECIHSIEQDADIQDVLSKAKEEIRLYKAMLRRNLMQVQFLDKNKWAGQWDEAFQKLEISLDLDCPVMLLGGGSAQELTEEIAVTIDLAMREKIAYAVKSEIVWMDGHVVIWAMQPVEPKNLQHSQAVIKGMAEGFQWAVKQRLGISISFVFWEKQVAWDQVMKPFEELKYIASNLLMPDSQIAMAGVEYFEERDGIVSEKNEAELEKSFVSRLMAYMTEHIDGDLSLYTLSEKLHLNPSYLSRRFKELTGRTLTESILRLRMETACKLLRTTAYSINEIASMVGYETAASFSKVFKKNMKITPREFRDREGTMQ